MTKSICGLDCDQCELKDSCAGCAATNGRPFHGECVIAVCCQSKGLNACGECGASCAQRERLIEAFNALGIEDMEPVTSLNALKGSFINIAYALPSGQSAKLWDDDKIYLGNQLGKKSSDRCYGIAADEKYLMVSEYGADGADAEIVVFKRWN